MKPFLYLPLAAALIASPALAQQATDPVLQPKPAPQAVPAPMPQADAPAPKLETAPAGKTDARIDPGAPLPGANSFTETQAKSRIEENGVSGVTALAKDKDGIWRGTGTRNGQQVNVALDYKGNVVVQ